MVETIECEFGIWMRFGQAMSRKAVRSIVSLYNDA